jgi:hypothetical protein
MIDKEIMKELYSCRVCQNTCLKGNVCSQFPEPLIGNWHANFVVLGINPGNTDLDFSDQNAYIAHYSDPQKCGLDLKERWQRGYFEAYKKLVNPKSSLGDFNKNAAILNIIKCPTKDVTKISNNNLQMAKANCIGYLMKQLKAMRPKVILSHGKFPCATILDILKNETQYTVVSRSCDVATLFREIQTTPYYIDEISKEYVIANEDGHKTLFLFNSHLSYCQIAMQNLDKNIEEKKRLIVDLLHRRALHSLPA